MSIILYGQYNDFDKLVIDFKSKHDGDIHVSYLKLDDNPLVTPQNAEAWVRYLHRRIKELITKEAMESEEFRTIREALEEQKRRKAEEEAEKQSLIPLNLYIEKTVFTRDNIDWECMTIGRMINILGKEVKKYLDRGQTHDALLLFLQIVKSMCRHYIKDEHYNFFDDMYDPDYSCMNIVDTLNEAYAKGKFAQSDIDFFHQAWKEIEQTKAYNEGIADYKFRF